MTKSLEQIQKENREFILEAIHHGCSYEKALQKELKIGKPLTFNRVLLAINITFNGYLGNFYFDEDFVHIVHLEFDGVSFDLTKETLEEQSEETQRAINKILKGE